MANSISNQVLRERAKTITPTVSTTLSEADSFLEVNVGVNALTMTLPKITADNIGLTYTFRNTLGSTGNITVAPNAVDAIVGTVGAVTSTGAVNKAIINTVTTSKLGDYIVLKAITLNKWYIQGGIGVWASQT